MRSKCRAEGLERPVYIGLGVGRPIHQAPGQNKWKGELSLAVGLPSNVTGGYTTGRMADIGSPCSEPDSVSRSGTRVLEGAPEL